ncbi:MAG: hypothetical protein QNJ53_01570 [Pleurocapsa sp. MO_192.B19]|nr:hypothetical protein [Pleurocapsa sp. MO_192.B19]
MLWGMELSFVEEEILRKYLPILRRYEVCFNEETCDLIENCHKDLESKIQAFIGWFLSLEYRASMENEKLILPDANEILVQALREEWYPTEFQKEKLMEVGLFPFELAIREKLGEINFFRAIAYETHRNSMRIKFFYHGEIIWEEHIPDLLKVSHRELIEMYKFRVNQHQENLKKLGFNVS